MPNRLRIDKRRTWRPRPHAQGDRGQRSSLPTTRVVHVVEAYGGGAAAAISDYAQSRSDLEHHLVYADRPDARVLPSSSDLFASRRALPSGHLARLAHLARLMRTAPPGTLFHAHSSLAGVYVRLAGLWARTPPTAYTPHCYGFERRDLSKPATSAIYAVEKVLTRISPSTAMAACSPRELALARRLHHRVRGAVVPNIAPDEIDSHGLRRPPRVRPVVVGAGRLTAQKDPRYFAACVEALHARGVEVDVHWLGDGDPTMRQALESAGVQVSGWLDRTEFTTRLGEADVYVHTGLWEGFPITVLEAVKAGVPTLVRDIPCMVGYHFPLPLDGPEDLAVALRLLQDDATWARVERHHLRLMDECSRELQVAALHAIYG